MAGKDLRRPVLGLLDVGLVERVDLEDGAGDGGRELPAVELRGEAVLVDAELGRLAIAAPGRVLGRWNEALALLPGGLGEELLEPESEAGRVLEDDLVATFQPSAPEAEPELDARVVAAPAPLGHGHRLGEQRPDVGAHERRRHHPEDGQRRVPAPDRRLAVEDGAKAALARQALELGARIGDRDAGLAALSGSLPEEVE